MVSGFLNFGIFFIALGALGVAEGLALYANTRIPYGPGQYLTIVSGLIFIVGVVYYAQTVKKAKNAGQGFSVPGGVNEAEPEAEAEVKALPKGVVPCLSLRFHIGKLEIKLGAAVLAFILFVLYAVLSRWIGYLFSTVLFIASAMLLFGERVWWKLCLSSAIGGLIFWGLFVKFAGIPL